MKNTIDDVLNLWNEPKLRAYLGEIRRKHGVVETLALPSLRDLPSVQIETLFVPPLLSIAPVHTDSDPTDWPEGKSLLEELNESRQLVVLGDPGGGKTTLSNWLAWRLTSGASAPLPDALANKIPFPCILRDMPTECFSQGFTVSDLAVATAIKLLGEAKAEPLEIIIRKWVVTGDYVLILDGIDEVPVHRRPLISSWINEAHQQNAVVLATSRIVGYEDYPVDSANGLGESENIPHGNLIDKTKTISSKRRSKNNDSSKSFEDHTRKWATIRFLMPFNQNQISDFARNWYSQRCVSDVEAKQKTADLLASLAQSEITQQLARTPNLLSLMAIVHRERAHLPDGKALLYEEIVNAYINTIDNQRRIGSENSLSSYGWKEKKSWLSFVGFKLQSSRDWDSPTAGILASEGEIIAWLQEAIDQSGAADSEILAKEFLNWVARRSGLLLPRGENRYAFVHLSFQEYFCACYLSDCIVRPAFVTGSIAKDSLVTRDTIAAWAQIPEWLETFIFLFESLSAEHGSEWVDIAVAAVFGDGMGDLSHLGARLIKNQHVKLPSLAKDLLASGCINTVFNELDYDADFESDVARTMLETGYAVLLSGETNSESNNLENNPSWAEKVKILIINEGFNLTAKQLSLFNNLEAISTVNATIDLAGLSNPEHLDYFRADSTKVINFQKVETLKNLSTLELRNSEIASLAPISKLTQLHILEISNLPILNLNPIEKLTNIHHLRITTLNLSDLNPIGCLKKLESISLSDIPVTDISFVKNLLKLDYVHLSGLPLDNLDSFSTCKKIETLDINHLKVDDLSPISQFGKLNNLFMSAVDIKDLTPLGKLKKLVIIMMNDMKIPDLSPLSKCKNLLNVFINKSTIDNIESIGNLKTIHALSLVDIPSITNITYLRDFSNLRYLDISGCPIGDISILESMKTPFSLRLRSDHTYDLSFLSNKDGFNISFKRPV